MTQTTATELAALRKTFPGESADYSRIRQELLSQEIELQ